MGRLVNTKSYTSFDRVDQQWWRRDMIDRWVSVVHVAKKLEESLRGRDNDYWRFARMYGGLIGNDLLLGLKNFISSNVNQTARVPRFSYNVAKAVTDTSVAKITATDVKTSFVTDGGTWAKQRRAQKLDQFGQGLHHATKMRTKGPKLFRDGCVFGMGIVKVYEEGDTGRICVDRTLPHEILVDDQDGMDGDPRQMVQRKTMARDVAAKRWPKARRAIMDAPRADRATSNTVAGDRIVIYEAWHLPSIHGADDGYHLLCVEGGILEEEEYDEDHFPFPLFRYLDRLVGFGGFGLLESGFQIQVEINRINRVIQENLHFMAVGRVFLPVGSKIVKSHLSTIPGALIEYVGQVPTFSEGGGINPQVLEYRDDLYRKYFELGGVSQMAAQNLKPAGLDSAVALRAYADNQAERFTPVAKNFEQFMVDVSSQCVALARKIYERDGHFTVKVPGSKFLNTVDWREVDLEADEFEIKAWPANALPTTPEARIQKTQELMQAGLMDPASGRKALDFPDLQAANDLANADSDVIESIIDRMLDKGEYESPDLYVPLQQAFTRTKQHYWLAKRDGAPDDKLELLRRYMTECQARIAEMTPPAPMGGPGAAPGGSPQAAPMPPPQSNLLPNSPSASA